MLVVLAEGEVCAAVVQTVREGDGAGGLGAGEVDGVGGVGAGEVDGVRGGGTWWRVGWWRRAVRGGRGVEGFPAVVLEGFPAVVLGGFPAVVLGLEVIAVDGGGETCRAGFGSSEWGDRGWVWSPVGWRRLCWLMAHGRLGARRREAWLAVHEALVRLLRRTCSLAMYGGADAVGRLGGGRWAGLEVFVGWGRLIPGRTWSVVVGGRVREVCSTTAGAFESGNGCNLC